MEQKITQNQEQTQRQIRITIGAWDGEQKTITVIENATLNDALRIAGLVLAPSQQITAYSNAERISPNEMVVNGETYIITGNQTSG